MDSLAGGGRKQTFSPHFINSWSLECKNVANIAQKQISCDMNTHSTSTYTKFELYNVKTFSDNSKKPPFSVIYLPLEGQNLADMAQN